mmetsp:Transcript_32153/g.49168  ORF Transcript_32153/g.49168 Transcript_32153/m.49168 type:complete len:107 (-) Transcript_32153:291-611(-)
MALVFHVLAFVYDIMMVNKPAEALPPSLVGNEALECAVNPDSVVFICFLDEVRTVFNLGPLDQALNFQQPLGEPALLSIPHVRDVRPLGFRAKYFLEIFQNNFCFF